jgi:hypothetical protein
MRLSAFRAFSAERVTCYFFRASRNGGAWKCSLLPRDRTICARTGDCGSFPVLSRLEVRYGQLAAFLLNRRRFGPGR